MLIRTPVVTLSVNLINTNLIVIVIGLLLNCYHYSLYGNCNISVMKHDCFTSSIDTPTATI
jgi:hypothetical protein